MRITESKLRRTIRRVIREHYWDSPEGEHERSAMARAESSYDEEESEIDLELVSQMKEWLRPLYEENPGLNSSKAKRMVGQEFPEATYEECELAQQEYLPDATKKILANHPSFGDKYAHWR